MCKAVQANFLTVLERVAIFGLDSPRTALSGVSLKEFLSMRATVAGLCLVAAFRCSNLHGTTGSACRSTTQAGYPTVEFACIAPAFTPIKKFPTIFAW